MTWTKNQVYYRPRKRGVFDLMRFIANVLVGVDVGHLRVPTSLSAASSLGAGSRYSSQRLM